MSRLLALTAVTGTLTSSGGSLDRKDVAVAGDSSRDRDGESPSRDCGLVTTEGGELSTLLHDREVWSNHTPKPL